MSAVAGRRRQDWARRRLTGHLHAGRLAPWAKVLTPSVLGVLGPGRSQGRPESSTGPWRSACPDAAAQGDWTPGAKQAQELPRTETHSFSGHVSHCPNARLHPPDHIRGCPGLHHNARPLRRPDAGAIAARSRYLDGASWAKCTIGEPLVGSAIPTDLLFSSHIYNLCVALMQLNIRAPALFLSAPPCRRASPPNTPYSSAPFACLSRAIGRLGGIARRRVSFMIQVMPELTSVDERRPTRLPRPGDAGPAWLTTDEATPVPVGTPDQDRHPQRPKGGAFCLMAAGVASAVR